MDDLHADEKPARIVCESRGSFVAFIVNFARKVLSGCWAHLWVRSILLTLQLTLTNPIDGLLSRCGLKWLIFIMCHMASSPFLRSVLCVFAEVNLVLGRFIHNLGLVEAQTH